MSANFHSVGDICGVERSIKVPFLLNIQHSILSKPRTKASSILSYGTSGAFSALDQQGQKFRPCIVCLPTDSNLMSVKANADDWICLMGSFEKEQEMDNLAPIYRNFLVKVSVEDESAVRTTPDWPHPVQYILAMPIPVENLSSLTRWRIGTETYRLDSQYLVQFHKRCRRNVKLWAKAERDVKNLEEIMDQLFVSFFRHEHQTKGTNLRQEYRNASPAS